MDNNIAEPQSGKYPTLFSDTEVNNFRAEQRVSSNLIGRVVYKGRQPAKFAGFSARFRRLLSLLHESKYVEKMDLQPSTFHKTPAT